MMMTRSAAAAAIPTCFALALAGCGETEPAPPPPGGGGPVTAEELAAGGDCATPAGAGTDHAGFIQGDETWTEAGSPHVIKSNVRITATVTVEPCATVLLEPGVLLEVGSSSDRGRLVARGEVVGAGSDRQVRSISFKARQAGQPWGQVLVNPPGAIELAVAALEDGGQPGGGTPAALAAYGPAGGTNTGEVTRNVTVDRVLIERARGHGASLLGWAAFTAESRTLWIRGSGAEALLIEPGIAATLPPELSLSGNARDQIRVASSKTFMRDDTFVARGAPYRFATSPYVSPPADGAPVTLRVEAGVTLAFEAGTAVVVGSTPERQGVLVAEGQAGDPVVFASALDSKAPGDWAGIVFRYTPLTGNRIRHARVLHAGGESGANGFGCGPGDNDSAVLIYGQGQEDRPPAEVFIQDTTFDELGGTTVIVSGWTDDQGPNFAPGNTFGAGTPACKVSRPRRSGAGDVCDGGRRDSCWN